MAHHGGYRSAQPWWELGRCQDELSEVMFYMFRLICGALVPKSPLSIYANQMLPVPTTLFPEMKQADLEQLTA